MGDKNFYCLDYHLAHSALLAKVEIYKKTDKTVNSRFRADDRMTDKAENFSFLFFVSHREIKYKSSNALEEKRIRPMPNHKDYWIVRHSCARLSTDVESPRL